MKEVKNKKIIALILIIVCILTVSVILYLRISKPSEYTETAGIVEGREVNLSPKLPGRISGICCKEGDNVRAGDIVASLESADINALVNEAKASVESARADVKAASATVENHRASLIGIEADIKNAEAEGERAKALMVDAERQMKRAKELYKKGFIAKAEEDTATTNFEAAMAIFKASTEKIKSLLAHRDASLSILSASISQLKSVKARLKQAEANLSYQEAHLSDTIIKTPISGVVVFKAMEQGEYVSPGITILTIVDLADLWVRIDLEESYIGRIGLGDVVRLSIDGMPGRFFNGRIIEIGKLGDFATQKDVTRGRQDIKTFRVRIKPIEGMGVFKPGMTVNVRIPSKP